MASQRTFPPPSLSLVCTSFSGCVSTLFNFSFPFRVLDATPYSCPCRPSATFALFFPFPSCSTPSFFSLYPRAPIPSALRTSARLRSGRHFGSRSSSGATP